jgi:alpha-tubulin suppressor-like RCC1 family protein
LLFFQTLAIIAAAEGPSGKNEYYLNCLDGFLEGIATSSAANLGKFDDTIQLASMEKTLRNYKLHFLFGTGSNQHNQLLLASETNAADLVNGEDAHEMKDMVLCTPSYDQEGGAHDPVQQVFAGGGHSAILTESGRLYPFGWNESGQLGKSEVLTDDSNTPVPLVSALEGVRVEAAALGFNHSLVIEKNTGRLLAFGDNSRGQVDGTMSSKSSVASGPRTPEFLRGEHVVHAAAGLFHSAIVTREGEVVTFGCGRFGQSLSSVSSDPVWVGRWRPDDGSKFIRVGCGRRQTTVLDDRGRIWTFGENKYGQLGRAVAEGVVDATPRLVDIPEDGWKCHDIQCGWSHTIVVGEDAGGSTSVFGWGRCDKGQLGMERTENVSTPIRLFGLHKVQSVACGSESTIVVDAAGDIWSCGWNEHGNLASGGNEDLYALSKVIGAPITTTPGYPRECHVTIAAGGAHVLAMKVPKSSIS